MNRVQKQMNAFLEVSQAHWEPGLHPEVGRGPPPSWGWARGGGPSHVPHMGTGVGTPFPLPAAPGQECLCGPAALRLLVLVQSFLALLLLVVNSP